MNPLDSGNGLQTLEAAYQTMGELIRILTGQLPPSTTTPESLQTSVQRVTRHRRCRDYIKYPSPPALRPRASAPFKIAELCKAYSFPTGLSGGGVIGILELGGGYHQADLDRFSSLNGLPQIVPTDVPVSGGQNSPGTAADGEVLLDIQVAAAVYYYCTGQMPEIRMYFAPNDSSAFATVINQTVADECDVLSISWGSDEDSWDPAVARQVESAAAAATENGCVIFAASGDNSSSDGSPGANVDLPSSCPHIIGCGGTTKTPFSEVVWGDGTPNGRGTGGGYSILFPPQDWQKGAPPSPGKPGRMVPDVAADADPDTGYLIVINGQEVQIGGTSAVAPLYSGLFASFGRKLGFVTPTLYENSEAFHDITQGSNGSFSAAPGPDPCTGLGVPIGVALANLFVKTGAHRGKRPTHGRVQSNVLA